MSSFTSQPSTSNLHSVLEQKHNGTLNYTFETTVTSNTNAPALTVEYWINSSKFREIDIDGYDTRTQDGSDYDYTYDLDASKVVKDFFDNTNFFFPSSSPYQNASLQASLQLKIYVWSPDSDGVLTKGGSTTDSNTADVLNTLVSGLSDYNATSNRKLLTNQPNESYHVLGEKKYLSVWLDNTYVTHVRFRTYDTSDTLQNTLIVDLETVYNDDEVCIVSLLDSDIEGYTGVNGTNSIDISESHYYIVDFGTWADPIFTSYTESKIYYTITDAYRKLTFHYQNLFGCQESITLFDDQWSEKENATFETYRSRTRGLVTFQGEKSRNISIKLMNQDTEDFNYLKEVLESSVFYFNSDEYTLQNRELLTNEIENKNNIELSFTKSVLLPTY